MKLQKFIVSALVVACTGCNSTSNLLNPFYEPPTEEALMGERNDKALNDGETKADKAREALEAMSSYKRAQQPAPYDPVMQPAVVRLMWVPDHLNVHGDLIPAHYYYLKVLSDRWAVSDAFELEGQLNKGSGSASAVPFTTKDDLDASK